MRRQSLKGYEMVERKALNWRWFLEQSNWKFQNSSKYFNVIYREGFYS